MYNYDMPRSTLTNKEREIYYHLQKTIYGTSLSISKEVPGVSYPSAVRFLNNMERKGYIIKSKERHEDGYRYSVPKSDLPAKIKTVIPFKGTHNSLEDLLLYISQNTAQNDFQKYGIVLQAAIYHLITRVMLQRSGRQPFSPSPVETKQFIDAVVRRQYKEFISLIQTIADLPLYSDNDDVLEFFTSVSPQFLDEQEEFFTDLWKSGIATPQGLKDKFSSTIRQMKDSHIKKYGEGEDLHE